MSIQRLRHINSYHFYKLSKMTSDVVGCHEEHDV